MPLLIPNFETSIADTLFGEPGTVRALSPAEVREICDAIKLDGAQAKLDARQASAFPTIWQQYISFLGAFIGEYGSKKDQEVAVAQWRAVLTVLGLCELNAIPLTSTYLPPVGLIKEELRDIDEETVFSWICRNHAPQFFDRMGATGKTRRLRGFFVEAEKVLEISETKSVPIGFEAPICIVCPVRFQSFPENSGLSSVLPFIGNGVQLDPLRTHKLTDGELLALQEYVVHLKNEISNWPRTAYGMSGRDWHRTVEDHCARFLSDIIREREQLSESFLELTGLSLEGDPTQIPPLRATNKVVPRESRENGSEADFLHAFINTVPDCADTDRYTDRTLAIGKSVDRSGKETRLLSGDQRFDRILPQWGLIYQGQAQRSSPLKSQVSQFLRLRGGKQSENRRYLDVDDIFENALLRFVDKADERRPITAHSHGFEYVLLPIKKEAAELLNLRSIFENLKVEYRDDRYTVSLELPTRRNGDIGSIKLQRNYAKGTNHDIIECMRPAVYFWPDILRSDLTDSYSYISSRSAVAYATACLPKQFLTEGEAGETQAWEIDISEFPFRSGVQEKLYHNDQRVLAIEFEAAKSNGPRSSGLMLIDQTASNLHYGTLEAGATLGIDFGTSSTTVYIRQENIKEAMPEKLEFELTYWQPLAAEAEPLITRNFQTQLVPFSPIQSPFRTIWRERNDENLEDRTLPFYRGHIFFANTVDESILADLNRLGTATGSSLRCRFKWEDGSDNRLVDNFMRQLIYQCIIELVERGLDPGKTKWRFSWPRAFSDLYKESYVGRMGLLVNEGLAKLNLEVPNDLSGRIDNRPESLCAALFFLKRGAEVSPYDVAIYIDIGGETSDVSIWHNRKLLWEGSLKLAGRTLLTRYLCFHTEQIEEWVNANSTLKADSKNRLLDALRINSMPKPGEPVAESAFDAFETVLSAMSHEAELDIFDIIQNSKPFMGDLESYKKAAGFAEICMYGVFTYIANVLRFVVTKYNRHENSKIRLESRQLDVGICGRGSRQWQVFLSGGSGTLRKLSQHFFDVMGVDSKSGLNIRYAAPEFHKHEVAYGLVVDDSDINAEFENVDTTVLLGIEMPRGRGTLKPIASVLEFDSTAVHEYKPEVYRQFMAFWDDLAPNLSTEALFIIDAMKSPEHVDEVRRNLQNTLDEAIYKNKRVSEQHRPGAPEELPFIEGLQSPFVVMLRSYLDIAAKI